MLADDHENKVNDPHNGETENQTNESGYDLAFGKSGYPAANPRRNGDYSQYNADYPRQSEVITFLCHNLVLLLIFVVFIILFICDTVKYISEIYYRFYTITREFCAHFYSKKLFAAHI